MGGLTSLQSLQGFGVRIFKSYSVLLFVRKAGLQSHPRWFSPLCILMWCVFMLKREILDRPYYVLSLWCSVCCRNLKWLPKSSSCNLPATAIVWHQTQSSSSGSRGSSFSPRRRGRHTCCPSGWSYSVGEKNTTAISSLGHFFQQLFSEQLLDSRTSVFEGEWCSRRGWLDGVRRCAFRFLLHHPSLLPCTSHWVCLVFRILIHSVCV